MKYDKSYYMTLNKFNAITVIEGNESIDNVGYVMGFNNNNYTLW